MDGEPAPQDLRDKFEIWTKAWLANYDQIELRLQGKSILKTAGNAKKGIAGKRKVIENNLPLLYHGWWWIRTVSSIIR